MTITNARDAFLTTLTPERVGSTSFRSTHNEPNPVGRVYGGQSMGQTVAVALATVAAGRLPSSLQISFLSGPRPELPIDYVVASLQDGKRVSTRSVQGRQGERGVVSALVSAQIPAGERHQDEMRRVIGPENAVTLEEVSPEVREQLGPSGFLGMSPHPHIDYRFVDPRQLVVRAPLQIWLRVRHRLPADPRIHAAALAYLSDWWLAFPGIAPYVDRERFYLASLNHSLWFHVHRRADEWLLVEMESAWASEVRGLSRGRIFAADGALVASVAQDCLQATRD